MPEFRYRAIDEKGGVTSGVLEAFDRKSALVLLSKMRLRPISVSSTGESSQVSDEQGEEKALRGGEAMALALIRKLHQLCGAGMPVGDALKSLSVRSLNKVLKRLSRNLYKDLGEGKTLADSISKYPNMFDPCVVHLVEAGESTANLEFVFANIINYIESRRKLRATVISAIAYPIFLCCLAFGVVALFVFFMLPKIRGMMENLGAEENFPVKMMNFLGSFITSAGPFLLVLAVAVFFSVKFWRKSKRGKSATDSFFLKLPIIGKIIFDSEICRFSNLAATLFDSGVNTTEAFRLSEKSLKNEEMRSRFQSFRIAVNDGAPIAAALHRYKLLGDEDIDIIAVGERTGSLVKAFEEIHKAHTDSLNIRIKVSTGTLAGVALGTAFLLVFIFAVGIVLSILGLSNSMLPS